MYNLVCTLYTAKVQIVERTAHISYLFIGYSRIAYGTSS